MKIYIKKPFLTDAEKKAQDWVLRAKPPKITGPMSVKEAHAKEQLNQH